MNIIIVLSGGLIREIIQPSNVSVEVRDYDVMSNVDPRRLRKDSTKRVYERTIWLNNEIVEVEDERGVVEDTNRKNNRTRSKNKSTGRRTKKTAYKL